MKFVPWIVVGAVLLIVAFFALKPASAGVTVVDVKGVQKAAAEGVRIVDVRSVGEYEGGHIPGAQNVPLDQLQSVASQWDKNAPVLVYCQTGARSAEAVSMLTQAGLHQDHCTSTRESSPGPAHWSRAGGSIGDTRAPHRSSRAPHR